MRKLINIISKEYILLMTIFATEKIGVAIFIIVAIFAVIASGNVNNINYYSLFLLYFIMLFIVTMSIRKDMIENSLEEYEYYLNKIVFKNKGEHMKNIVGIILMAFISIFILNGCVENSGSNYNFKSNYEDIDMTNSFRKDNLKYFNKILKINVKYENTLSYDEFGRGGYYKLDTVVSFINGSDERFNIGNHSCNYVLSIDYNHLIFEKEDVEEYGKVFMYKEAQKCFDFIVKEIEEDEEKYHQRKKNFNEKFKLLYFYSF